MLFRSRWAPEEARFTVAPSLPPAASALTTPQRTYLARVKDELDGRDAETMQARLYEIAKEIGLVDAAGRPTREAFTAIYLALLGKPSGPRAAWLVVALDPAFVRLRFAEAAR